jgi:hypothetical protein
LILEKDLPLYWIHPLILNIDLIGRQFLKKFDWFEVHFANDDLFDFGKNANSHEAGILIFIVNQ